MSKKVKKDINKIIQNKNKSKISNIFYLLSSIFFLGLILLQNYISNDGLIESVFYYLIEFIRIIFGSSAFIFFLLVLIVNSISIFLGNRRIKINLIRKICIVLSFLFFTIFLTSLTIDKVSNNMLDAGQDILSNGFLGKGGGLIGSISSIIFFKLINNRLFSFFSLIFSILLGILGFGKSINILYKLFSKTYSYYYSEEYINKKEILKAKDEYYKNQKALEEQKEIEELTSFLIVKSDEKLDKEISKNPNAKDGNEVFFNEEELNNRKQEWKKYFESIEVLKEKARLEREKKEKEEALFKMKKDNIAYVEKEENKSPYIMPNFEKEENVEYMEEKIEEEIEEIKYEKEEELLKEENIEKEDVIFKNEIKEEMNNDIIKKYNEISPLNREEIEKSIEMIFQTRNMDPLKKEEMKKQISDNISLLEEVLYNFGVEAKVVDYATGPTVTRYEIQIPNNVKVKRVTELESEITMNLRAESIRIEAPIPGKAAIGIETPNKIKEPVYFSNLIHSEKMKDGVLPVILGKDIIGRDKIIDIAKLPHLLIGGTTGSGKSICINTIIASLISKKSDDEVKLILIDPKMVEMMPYNNIPHLLTPVITDAKTASIALKWAVNEMENRYRKLSSLMQRKIEEYNQKYKDDKMPYIVIVIDELADLMMSAADKVETSIVRLAQKARAVGIHLIVATQRPSTDVVTGLIKSNLPSRIAFTLRSYIDSRTVIDQVGAEKLLGKGDMLFLDNGSPNLLRVQGAYISDDEVINLTNLLRSKKRVVYDERILMDEDENSNNKTKDAYFDKAVSVCREMAEKPVSISHLQRELCLGFNRASRIIKQLKEENILDEDNIYIGE